MLINKISFQNNIYYKKSISFKGESENNIRNFGYKDSFSDSIYRETEQMAEQLMLGGENDPEKLIAYKEAKLKSLEEKERSINDYHSQNLASKQSKLSNIKKQIEHVKTIISDYQQLLSQLDSQEYNWQQANSSAQASLDEQNKTIENIKTETKNLLLQNQEYQEQLKNNFSEKIKILETEYNTKTETLKNNINNSIITPDSVIKEINTPKPNGFGSIAGFREVKADLIDKIGKFIVLEKNNKAVNVPNAILLFGPDIENNRDFADITANQFGTNSIKINPEGTETERFNELKQASARAKADFENGQGRTLIVINDFEKFAPKDSRMIGPLKSYLDSASKDFHTTIVATTEIPEALDDILLRSGRFGAKIAIPAIGETDILSFIHKYINIDFIDSIDINKLIQKLDIGKIHGAYSVKQLKNYIQSLTDTDCLKTLIPDIKPEAIKVFKQQLGYVKHL